VLISRTQSMLCVTWNQWTAVSGSGSKACFTRSSCPTLRLLTISCHFCLLAGLITRRTDATSVRYIGFRNAKTRYQQTDHLRLHTRTKPCTKQARVPLYSWYWVYRNWSRHSKQDSKQHNHEFFHRPLEYFRVKGTSPSADNYHITRFSPDVPLRGLASHDVYTNSISDIFFPSISAFIFFTFRLAQCLPASLSCPSPAFHDIRQLKAGTFSSLVCHNQTNLSTSILTFAARSCRVCWLLKIHTWQAWIWLQEDWQQWLKRPRPCSSAQLLDSFLLNSQTLTLSQRKRNRNLTSDKSNNLYFFN
jgi:hypothetical protein